nr:Gag-Pol polyprotein [Tanacetum cinerariifolium]
METKDTLSSCSNSEAQQMQQIQDKAKKSCMGILEFRDTLIQHLESVKKSIDEKAQHKREYDSWVNERQMQTTEEKVDMSKAKRSSFKSKVVLSSKERLNFLHMDLCGPMRVASINGKKYIMVIVDDYSRYTWTLFLRSKDETPEASDYDKFDPVPQLQNVSSSVNVHVPSQQELDLLFGPLYNGFFTAGTSSVNKSSSPTNNSNQQDTQPTTNIQPTSEPSTPTYVHAEENNDNQAEEEILQDDEFTNPLYTPVQEMDESFSHNIGNSNDHTFNQLQVSEYRWIKYHLLKQVRRNPLKPVQTRRQLATNPEMCMFALIVSTAEPKNIKEAMADSAWIEAMQEELP